MTITYPLVPPSVPGIRTSRLTANNIVATAVSPFTAEEEIQAFDGQWWSLEVGLPPMRRVLAEPWLSFLIGLGGRRGTFLMGDPDARAPRGSASGSPVVDGASQSGQTLATRGWVPNTSGVLLAGDYIQIGAGGSARLYKLLTDANSDATGDATLDVWPRLRGAPPDNTPIVTSDCVGLFRLADNATPWDTNAASVYGIAFEAREAL